jgi:hypothetical protein
VERFAGHLAHLLNAADSTVEVRPFALYQRLLQTLGSDGYRRLIGAQVAGGSRGAEEVAQRYFDTVLDRRLNLARTNNTHKGHDLLLALCRRGVDPLWHSAALRRANEAVPADGNSGRPHDFADVARRLDDVEKSISPGNPAESTRKQRGPLQLRAGEGRAEVAEELSIWKSIACAPTRLQQLEPGPEFNAFCSLVIKAVEAANAPYGAPVALGLSPFDWEGEVSTNTLKKLSVFLSEVRAEAGKAGKDWTDLQIWRVVWKPRPVPGYSSADELWHSELGRALRLPQVARAVDTIEIDNIAGELVASEPELLNAEAFAERLELCRAAGAIDDFDVWLYREIEAGKDIDNLAGTPEARKRFAGHPAQLAAYVEELTERVLAWVQSHLDPRDGDRSHPDKEDDPAENQG